MGGEMSEYTLVLSDDDLQAINAGLQELPMKIAAPLIMKINKQLHALQSDRDGEQVSTVTGG